LSKPAVCRQDVPYWYLRTRINGAFWSASIGFELERRFGGQGLMRKALSSIVDHAYDRWDISRIQATTDLDNHASIGLLRSLGFIEEGIMRQWGTGKTHFTTFVFFP
jgi:ribosomal-protein-alanine N-acetyltransferase